MFLVSCALIQAPGHGVAYVGAPFARCWVPGWESAGLWEVPMCQDVQVSWLCSPGAGIAKSSGRFTGGAYVCPGSDATTESHGSSSLVLLAASGEWLTEVRVWAGRTCSSAGGDGGSPMAIVSPAL